MPPSPAAPRRGRNRTARLPRFPVHQTPPPPPTNPPAHKCSRRSAPSMTPVPRHRVVRHRDASAAEHNAPAPPPSRRDKTPRPPDTFSPQPPKPSPDTRAQTPPTPPPPPRTRPPPDDPNQD